MWSKALAVLLIMQLQCVTNTPLRTGRSPREFQQVLISSVPVQHYYTNVLTPLYFPQQIYKDVLVTRNYSLPIFPFLIPIHNIVSTGHRLIPVRDLSVVPLSKERAVDNDEAPSNQFRNFYGGYGTGLLFGGHGAGHGFYAYGK